MKKLLACVLALSFCTVDAGLISSIKNTASKVKSKVKNSVSKVKNKTSAKKQTYTWLNNVKSLVSSVRSDIQEVYNNAPNAEVQTTANNMNTVLTECEKDPFQVIIAEKSLNAYIDKQKEKNAITSQLSTNYGKLSTVIDEYNKAYDNNLTNMKNAVASIKSGWPDVSDITNSLDSLLNNCTVSTVSINLSSIQEHITKLSDKLGTNQNLVKSLNDGAEYLKTHVVEYQEQSKQTFSDTVANAMSGTSNAVTSGVSRVNSTVKSINDAANILKAATKQ